MTTSTLKNTVRGTRLLVAEDPGDALLWDSLVDSASTPDVYYRPGYLSAYQAIGDGNAVAVLVQTGVVRALFPLLLRPLKGLSFAAEETGYDAVSAYGYGGLLLLDGAISMHEQQSRQLLQGLLEWCRENQVISALVRLNPVFQQERWFGGPSDEDFGLTLLGPTTAIDLSRWNSATSSIATLTKGRRSDLSYARRHLRLTWTSDGRDLQDDLHLFYRLYEHRMTQLEADDYYHFDFEYYTSLAQGLKDRLDIAVAWLHSEPVGAALFMTDRLLSHYHLSASNGLGRAYKATTLILNGAAEHARLRGCQHLHLGGGAHGEDKLFTFKRSFGGDVYRYSFISLICDALRYGRLVQMRMGYAGLPALRTNFFPEYRA